MKVHIGVDSQSGLVHSASVTAANVHDSQELSNLVHGQETRLYGDSAYRGKNQRERLKQIAPRARDFTNKPAHRHRALSERDRQTNCRKSAVRASRTPVSDLEAYLGLYEGTLSRVGKERQPCLRHAGTDQH